MKPRLQFLRNEAIDAVTAQRIREYESATGVTARLPVPVEQIVEQVLNRVKRDRSNKYESVV